MTLVDAVKVPIAGLSVALGGVARVTDAAGQVTFIISQVGVVS